MMALIEKLPPEISLALLDLVVDMSDVPGREEVVARIRKLNGQRDPATDGDDPQAQAEEAAKAAEQQKQKQMDEDERRAKIRLVSSQADKVDAEKSAKLVETLYEAVQTGQVLATVPGIAPLADEIALSAGYKDLNPPPLFPSPQGIGGIPAPEQTNTSPMFPPKPVSPGVGLETGIETQRLDGIRR
jgi:hypothetical protein